MLKLILGSGYANAPETIDVLKGSDIFLKTGGGYLGNLLFKG
ncbi:MAG: hypothetical protein ABI861_09660 [Panacibacter sp.]